MVSHILAIGETQSGKTYACNQLHREGPRGLLSVFFNTNQVGYVWGTRVTSLHGFVMAVANGDRRINYVPPGDLPSATQHLWRLWLYLLDHAAEGPVWCRLLIDEAQRFESARVEGPVEDAARRGLGKGIQVVVITQYPVGLKPGTRTNCPSRIIFKPGIEGERFLRTYGSYPPEIIAHTARQRCAASYKADRGWRLHPPVGTS